MYHNGIWGTVCDDGWGMNDAHVVCRELGFPRALYARYRAYFGPGTGRIWLNEVRCRGNENTLSNCSHRGWGILRYRAWQGYCKHLEDAGVVCLGKCHDKELCVNNVSTYNIS